MSQLTSLFSDFIALVEHVLSNRQEIADRLERRLFSAQGRAAAQSGDRESIAEILHGCFFESSAVSQNLSGLNGRLRAAHLADGFEPARQDGYLRDLDPSELVLRACHHWDRGRWPGRNGRLAFAQNIYFVFVFRLLEQLSLRIWDDGHELAPERLQHLQRLLDGLNGGWSSPHGTGLVRDARWLIQTAQGALTRHVQPYFIKADHVSTLNDARLEIHKAGAVLAGGHLRSQLLHLSRQTGWAFDDPPLLALTRSSNSMDMALLVRDLVPLLDAYAAACARPDGGARLALADAILQGLSADPELLLTRLDLLGPSTMIEDLFIDRTDATASGYSSMGKLHRESLARYRELVAATAESLQHDSSALDPAGAAYSPLGIVYGFCADLLSNMVLNTLRSASGPDLTLEDLFISQGRLEEKRAQAYEWERLPKREGEPNAFEHSGEWAARMYARLAGALQARVASRDEPNASRVHTSCLYVAPVGVTIDSLSDGVLPDGIASAQEHCLTSDISRARAIGATVLPAGRLITDRAEGRFLACAESDGALFGVSKTILTLFMSQGKDALITDVPRPVIDVLRMVCSELLVVMED